MKERPILFSTPMVRAILEGRKTQTRRIIKESYNGCLTNGGPHPCPNDPVVMYPGEVIKSPIVGEPDIVIEGDRVHAHFYCSTMDKIAYCHYGKAGDTLYVRESWAKLTYGDHSFIGYKADNGHHSDRKWKPSIHMPRSAARIWLEVTNVRVEALHDISEENAKAEGIERDEIGFRNYDKKVQQEYGHPDHDWPHLVSPIDSYKSLWQSINGNWDENPWVWVVEFKVLSTTGKPTLCKATTSVPGK